MLTLIFWLALAISLIYILPDYSTWVFITSLVVWLTAWFFVFILHFIKVFITGRFMNKNWEREQIGRLVALQEKKIAELNSQINEEPLLNKQE